MNNEERGRIQKLAHHIQCALRDLESGDDWNKFRAAEYVESMAAEAAKVIYAAIEREEDE